MNIATEMHEIRIKNPLIFEGNNNIIGRSSGFHGLSELRLCPILKDFPGRLCLLDISHMIHDQMKHYWCPYIVESLSKSEIKQFDTKLFDNFILFDSFG